MSSPSSLDMTTATTNNPSSSLGLSSVQLNSLALAPSSTELLDVSNAIQRIFESGGASGFGSFPLVTIPDNNSVTVREAFEMRSSNGNVGALVKEIIENVSAAIWEALMSNDVIRNFLKTGHINTSDFSQQLGCFTASERASTDAERGKFICAIIWQMLKVFSMWDMIKGFMDKLFLRKDGSIELDEEPRKRLVRISLAVSIVICLGVLAARISLAANGLNC